MSEAHLFKILKVLVSNNFVRTLRGRNGGIMLARPAEQISVGEVVRAAEESFLLAECFDSGRRDCPLITSCGFNGLLHEALEAFMNVLDAHTIAELAEQRSEIRFLLKMDDLPAPATGAAKNSAAVTAQ